MSTQDDTTAADVPFNDSNLQSVAFRQGQHCGAMLLDHETLNARSPLYLHFVDGVFSAALARIQALEGDAYARELFDAMLKASDQARAKGH